MPATNLNTVLLTGNLTEDPELRVTGGGTSICELRIASNSSFKKDDKWESKAHFFQINVWAAQGENCAKYLKKGSKIGVNGRLEYQQWENKEGKTNSRVIIVANQVEFLANYKTTEEVEAGKKDEGDDSLPDF
jgi:single-strand DNA-binding protein